MIDLVKYAILSEKATLLVAENQYMFDVDVSATRF
jgi:ribosomal protein L23